jgi:hypothetical protein
MHSGLDNISLQKQTAELLYKQITIIDPECILVGGAPRDWYFNQEATDLDFFFVPSAEISIQYLMSLLGISLVSRRGTTAHHLCEKMPGPLKIWEAVFNSIKIQLVEISSKEIMSVAVDELHLSISKIVWLPSDNFKIHKDFSKTLETSIIYGKSGYDLNSPYAQKILAKYSPLGYSLDL